MADGRTEQARVAPPSGRPGPGASQPASGGLRAQINRAYASSAPIVEDEPDTRRPAAGQPPGPLPETAARFAAAMAAVEQQQAAQGAPADRVPDAGPAHGGPAVAPPAAPPAPSRR